MSIASRRKQLGLSQADVGKALNVDQSAVHLWETGKAKPATKRLIPLAALLKCTVDELLNSDNTPEAKV